jgi:hypothetical protein
MKYEYALIRHKFFKKGPGLILPAGQRIVQVIDKIYESDGVILAVLIEMEA